MFKKGMDEAQIMAVIAETGWTYKIDDCDDYIIDDGCQCGLVLEMMDGKISSIYREDYM